MKDKSWIIILIMGIALTISIAYSVIVSKQEPATSTVTTTSIIEMTASTVTIKNTLTGTGIIEYKEKPKTQVEKTDELSNKTEQEAESINNTVSEENVVEEPVKAYLITLAIENKDLKKAKIDQDVEISVKEEEEILLYTYK